MWSHHSHSGQYCSHASDQLEQIIQRAIEMGFTTYCLTEHVPRDRQEDLYPEEAHLIPSDLYDIFDKYYKHAKVLQTKYKNIIKLLVGFETDYIHGESFDLIARLRKQYHFDMFVGSIHHVRSIPIDFDHVLWNKAESACGGLEGLYEEYFDTQYAMLQRLEPPIVGHFDLIKLKSPDHTIPLTRFPSVWQGVIRNINFIAEYGGMMEINSAALRKGWEVPYPSGEVTDYARTQNVKFCLSDDSHGLAQVGSNYGQMISYLKDQNIETIHYMSTEGDDIKCFSLPVHQLTVPKMV